MKAPHTPNTHDTREAWLRAAANELRPYFESCDLMLPEKDSLCHRIYVDWPQKQARWRMLGTGNIRRCEL